MFFVINITSEHNYNDGIQRKLLCLPIKQPYTKTGQEQIQLLNCCSVISGDLKELSVIFYLNINLTLFQIFLLKILKLNESIIDI